MVRLLRVEFTRLRWRRAALVLLSIAFATPLVILGVTAWVTRPLTTAELEAATARMLEDRKDPSFELDLRTCIRDPELYGLPPDATDLDCEILTQPQVDWYFDRVPLDLAGQQGASGLAVVLVLMSLVALVGTTFAGNDWATGSISNQLLTESRRTRVWVAKALVILLAGLALGAVILSAFWTGLLLIAEHRGLSPPRSEVVGAYLAGGRGTLLVGGAGLLGYAAAMLTRSTLAPVLAILTLAWIVPLVIKVGQFESAERFSPQQNFVAVALDGVRLDHSSAQCANGEPTTPGLSIPCSHQISRADGGAYLGALLLGTMAASLGSFRRRDV